MLQLKHRCHSHYYPPQHQMALCLLASAILSSNTVLTAGARLLACLACHSSYLSHAILVTGGGMGAVACTFLACMLECTSECALLLLSSLLHVGVCQIGASLLLLSFLLHVGVWFGVHQIGASSILLSLLLEESWFAGGGRSLSSWFLCLIFFDLRFLSLAFSACTAPC